MHREIQNDYLKFHDFNICPNILHVDADADTDADADAGGIKCRRAKNGFAM